MNRNKYNAEMYHDPTPYEAMKNIAAESAKTKYKPFVYICSPYAGDIKGNVIRARNYSKFAAVKNTIPVAPHLLYPQFLDDSDAQQRETGLAAGLALLGICRELWVFGSRISTGMSAEIRKASKRRMTIRFFDEECREVSKLCGNR